MTSQRTNELKFILSAVELILVAHLCSRALTAWFGQAAIIPIVLIYWGLIVAVIRPNGAMLREAWTGTRNRTRNGAGAERAKSGRAVLWNILAYLPALVCLVPIVWGFGLIAERPGLFVWTVLFALVNPWFEELMWRKGFSDRLSFHPVVRVALGTALFAVSHPLIWGVFSEMIRNARVMVVPLLMMGAVWGTVYERTGSLKHAIIAHALVDLFSMTGYVFVNGYPLPF